MSRTPEPLVSLLVPTFNREDYLADCLDSALAQTMRDLEVVVVDGASTDRTWEICRSYAAADDRVRVFRDENNTGPVRGWWRCLEEARGQFATFLWSDDMLAPQFLEQLQPLITADVAFAFSAAEVGVQPGEGLRAYSHSDGYVSSQVFIREALRSTAAFPVSPACALFRRDDLTSGFTMKLPTHPPADLTSTGAGTDLLMYLNTAMRYPAVACVPAPLAFFRVHPGSLTIDGRNGEVQRNYLLTRAWFARTHGHRPTARSILTRAWLGEMRRRRRLVSPSAAARSFGGLISPSELLAGAVPELLRRSPIRRWAGRVVRSEPVLRLRRATGR